MATPLIQNAFASGELSPALAGRTDIPKYRSGAARMRNFYVDYRGGASTRPGTQMVGILPDFVDDLPPRLIPFRFSTEQAYILEFQSNRMRVIRDGAYVTDATHAITNIVAEGGTQIRVTAAGHGVSGTNQQVFIDGVVGCLRPNGISGVNGRTFAVVSVAGADLILADVLGQPLTVGTWTAYTSGGTTARIYSIDTPWSSAELFDLKYVQSADVLTVVIGSVAPQNVNRLAENNWTITPVAFGAKLAPPANLTYVRHDGDGPDFAYPYCVTAYNTKTGDESAPSVPLVARNEALDQTTGVTNEMHWDAVAGADMYRLYKAQSVPWGSQGGGPYFWGLIGQTAALQYQDVNYAPDFDTVPPTSGNPFGFGAVIVASEVTDGISYRSPLVQISDLAGPGSGAAASAILDVNGRITGIIITNPGQNYISPAMRVIESGAPLYTGDQAAGLDPGTGGTFVFDGTWIPDPSAPGWFIPGPGSITVLTPGSGYHYVVVSAALSGGTGSSVGGTGHALINASTGELTAYIDSTPPKVMVTAGWTISFTLQDQWACMATSASTISISGGGCGNPADLEVGTAKNPSTAAYFQQRRVFGATSDAPQTFWMSRPGLYENFDTSFPSQDNDSISGTLVGNDVNSILSLTTIASGLVALTSGGAWTISGGSPQAAVTPSSISAAPQAFTGADPLPPLMVGSDIVYMQARGSAVQAVAFDFYQNSLVGQDITVLSSHLLRHHRLRQWCWSKEPNKLIWAVRDDGVLLSCTYAEGREIIGWSWHDTAGQYVSIATIPEGDEDAVYVTVRRYLAANTYRYVTERLVNRNALGNAELGIAANPESVWCVDAGRAYEPIYPDADLISGRPSLFQVTLGALDNLQIVAGGGGYPNNPTLVLEDPTGTGGVIQVTVTAGVITGATIVTPGTGYTNPTIRFEGLGMGAFLTVGAEDLMTFSTTSLSVSFGPDDIGKVLRIGGGRGVVIEADFSTFRARMDVMPLPVANLPEGETVYPDAAAGEWSLTPPVTVIGGLDQFNGMAVAVVADGSALDPIIVEDGCITLAHAASWVTAGQGYTCQLQTLRLPDAVTRRKQIPALTVRTMETRGLTVGGDFAYMTEVKDRPIETPMPDPQPFQTGGGPLEPLFENGPTAREPLDYDDHRTIISAKWATEGQLCFQQSYPMPATILAAMPEVSVGDTPG